jgi:hypothetical protein
MSGTIPLLPLYTFAKWTGKNKLLPFYNVKRQEGAHGVMSELTSKGKFQEHNTLHTTHESLAH